MMHGTCAEGFCLCKSNNNQPANDQAIMNSTECQINIHCLSMFIQNFGYFMFAESSVWRLRE